MDKDKYYIVTEDDTPAIETIPSVNGKAAVLCEQPDLAEEGENLEPITYSELALLEGALLRLVPAKAPLSVDTPCG